MPPEPQLAYLLGRVRQLTTAYMAGQPDSFQAFRELIGLLLHQTVLSSAGVLLLTKGPRENTFGLGRVGEPLKLNDGRFLRLSAVLYLEDTPDGRRLKVEKSSYQYQLDYEGDQWVFRYDYLRDPRNRHPPAHLQIRSNLVESSCLPEGRPLSRVHFPTGRLSLEAVIRLLVEEFGVPANTSPQMWRPILAESERAFLKIQHRPLSGPQGEIG